MESRNITNRIVIHHSASPPNTTREQIHQWHLAKGWSGIGYHYVIEMDGKVCIGRPDWAVGAHAIGANNDSIGICLAGNFEEAPPTSFQMKALADTIKDIRRVYGPIPCEGHKDVDPVNHPTACPGKLFPWDDLKKRLEARAMMKNVTEALTLLEHKGVITNKQYWTEAVKWYPNVDQLIISMANELIKEAL